MTETKDIKYLEGKQKEILNKIENAKTMDEMRPICGDMSPLFSYSYGDSSGVGTDLLQGIANSFTHKVLTLAGIPYDSYIYQWWHTSEWWTTTEEYKRLPYRYHSLLHLPKIPCTDEQWTFYYNEYRQPLSRTLYNLMLSNTHGEVLYHHNKAANRLFNHKAHFCNEIAMLSAYDVMDIGRFIASRIFMINDLIDAGGIILNWVFGYRPTKNCGSLGKRQVKNVLFFAQRSRADESKFICAGCGRQFNKQNATLDHIVPKSQGGEDHIQNHILLCKDCNGMKSDQLTYKGLRDKTKKGADIKQSKAAGDVYKRVKDTVNWICEDWHTEKVQDFLREIYDNS